MQDTCAMWDEMIATSKALEARPCTECGKPSLGYMCCHAINHPLCEACATVLEDGYQYCKRHVQDARDEIAEREVYAALAGLHQASLVQQENACRNKELIANLARLASFYMLQLRSVEKTNGNGA